MMILNKYNKIDKLSNKSWRGAKGLCFLVFSAFAPVCVFLLVTRT